MIVLEGVYKMRVKFALFAVMSAFLVLLLNASSEAVSTTEIDDVRNKGVLDSGDFRIIDDFVSEAVQDLVKTKDFTSIARARTVILSRSSSAKESARAQYTAQFFESANKYISSALEQASSLTPGDVGFKVMLNLLILVDNLENLRLADLAISMIKNENAAVRYWAIHAVTNPGITKQFNSSEAGKSKVQTIVEQLKKNVEKCDPETLGLMVEFVAEIDIPQGEDLLLQIADLRIKQYADWTVDDELLDTTILKSLCQKMSSAGKNKSAARCFGQLYSYAIQRYINGADFLSAAQKEDLASVLVETENSCIGKLLGIPQTSILRAVEQEDLQSLLIEHNRLLGDETQIGRLAAKLDYDYGVKPDGGRSTAPLILPKPPES